MKNYLIILISVITISTLFSQNTTYVTKDQTATKVKSEDFYLKDKLSGKGFVKFTPNTSNSSRSKSEITYVSEDTRYQGWEITLNTQNKSSNQWVMKDDKGTRIPVYCCTTTCCQVQGDTVIKCWTVSCYSKCDCDDCCQSFGDWLNSK